MPMKTRNQVRPGLLTEQIDKLDLHSQSAPHILVRARAGSGKTTTLIEGLKRIKRSSETSPWKPSQQQQAIFDAMCRGNVPSTIGFCAFNKSIAGELQRRVPPGCDAMTLHSLGLKAGDRLVFVGDEKQAIYAWAGADCQSMSQMHNRLKATSRGCLEMPLTFTRAINELIHVC